MNEDDTTPSAETPETQPVEPQIMQPVSAPEPAQPKSRKKVWVVLAVVLIIVLGLGLFYFLTKDKDEVTKTSDQKSSGLVLNNTNTPASKYNRSTELFAIGNVAYEAEELEVATPSSTLTSSVDALEPVQSEEGLSGVAFVESSKSTYDRSLVMYDFATGKSYSVNEDKGDQKVRHYYNPVILSDHYVAWYTLTYNTPVDLEGSISVVDLNTGEKKVILQKNASDLPVSNCCAVSPDGLYLVVPLPPNKIAFYSVGGEKTQEITVDASLVPQSEGQDGDSYAQSQRAISYPAVRWLDDKSIVLATNAPVQYKVDDEGTHISKDTNGLDVLNLESNKQTALVKDGTYSITWFDIADDGTLVFASHTADETLANGPITGDVGLYELDTAAKTGKPVSIEGITHDKLGALVLDTSAGILYVQEANAEPITAIKLEDNSKSTYSKGNPPLIEGALDTDTLVGGNREGLTPSTTLSIYKLSTGKVTVVY